MKPACLAGVPKHIDGTTTRFDPATRGVQAAGRCSMAARQQQRDLIPWWHVATTGQRCVMLGERD